MTKLSADGQPRLTEKQIEAYATVIADLHGSKDLIFDLIFHLDKDQADAVLERAAAIARAEGDALMREADEMERYRGGNVVALPPGPKASS